MTKKDDFGKIIYLNLDEAELYGWEEIKSDLIIDSMIKGIESGDDFPPIPVIKINNNQYEIDRNYKINVLSNMVLDGGHHRAVAHYIASKPIKAMITDYRNFFVNNFNIKNTVLGNDLEMEGVTFTLDFRRRVFPNYRF